MCDDWNWQLINPLPVISSPWDSRDGLEKTHGVSEHLLQVHTEEETNCPSQSFLLRKTSSRVSDMGMCGVADALPRGAGHMAAQLCTRTRPCSPFIYQLLGWESPRSIGARWPIPVSLLFSDSIKSAQTIFSAWSQVFLLCVRGLAWIPSVWI